MNMISSCLLTYFHSNCRFRVSKFILFKNLPDKSRTNVYNSQKRQWLDSTFLRKKCVNMDHWCAKMDRRNYVCHFRIHSTPGCLLDICFIHCGVKRVRKCYFHLFAMKIVYVHAINAYFEVIICFLLTKKSSHVKNPTGLLRTNPVKTEVSTRVQSVQ